MPVDQSLHPCVVLTRAYQVLPLTTWVCSYVISSSEWAIFSYVIARTGHCFDDMFMLFVVCWVNMSCIRSNISTGRHITPVLNTFSNKFLLLLQLGATCKADILEIKKKCLWFGPTGDWTDDPRAQIVHDNHYTTEALWRRKVQHRNILFNLWCCFHLMLH